MDPTLKTKTNAALLNRIADLTPQMKSAAKYVLDHPSDFGLDSIRETARKAQVSTYTFVKMSKTMGFASFEEFRLPYRHALVSSTNAQPEPDWLDGHRGTSSAGTLYANAAKNALSIVGKSLERQDIAQMEELAALLVSANKVYLTAFRSSYAVAYYLHYVGRMALPSLELIPHHQNSAIDDLNDATGGDVLIAITATPYSRETLEACAFAKKRGVKLVLITDSEVVSPDLAPEFTLIASVLSTHRFGCLSGMMAVVELLIAFLMDSGGEAARSRINSYDRLRRDNNLYWERKKTLVFP